MKKDTIYRQDAIDALEAKKDKSAKGDIGCFYNTIIQNDIDALKGLPSAESEPSQVARDIATIIENEQDMRVIARNAEPDAALHKAARKLAWIHQQIDLYDDRPELHEEDYWMDYLTDPEWGDPDIDWESETED